MWLDYASSYASDLRTHLKNHSGENSNKDIYFLCRGIFTMLLCPSLSVWFLFARSLLGLRLPSWMGDELRPECSVSGLCTVHGPRAPGAETLKEATFAPWPTTWCWQAEGQEANNQIWDIYFCKQYTVWTYFNLHFNFWITVSENRNS